MPDPQSYGNWVGQRDVEVQDLYDEAESSALRNGPRDLLSGFDQASASTVKGADEAVSACRNEGFIQ
jgi:hypothetical protein